MFKAFMNCFKIEDLRKRIIFTAGVIILCRIAANIPCPGIDPQALSEYMGKLSQSAGGGVLGMFDLFSGGAIQKFAIATLGIMPYISASIIMQLLVPVIPKLEKVSRDGEAGRQKITQYTRYLTLIICLFQGSGAAIAMVSPGNIGLPVPAKSLVYFVSGTSEKLLGFIPPHVPFVLMTLIVLTCTTMIFMWLGERITEKGIGNGISLIICINILARFPEAIGSLYNLVVQGQTVGGVVFTPVHLLMLLIVFIAVVAATIALTQGQRRITIQMARPGRGVNQGGTTYLPLKVNFAGVMPIIFAGAIIMVPRMVCQLEMSPQWIKGLAPWFTYGYASYIMIYAIMILLFSYFWVANMFKPIQISENLKREGAYIPGIKPGTPTSDFLDITMTKITFAGSIFLTALAVFPMLLNLQFKIPFMVASFFGGTSILIIVGVILDTLTQMESFLVMQNYDGFMKGTALKGRK